MPPHNNRCHRDTPDVSYAQQLTWPASPPWRGRRTSPALGASPNHRGSGWCGHGPRGECAAAPVRCEATAGLAADPVGEGRPRRKPRGRCLAAVWVHHQAATCCGPVRGPPCRSGRLWSALARGESIRLAMECRRRGHQPAAIVPRKPSRRLGSARDAASDGCPALRSKHLIRQPTLRLDQRLTPGSPRLRSCRPARR